MDAIKPYLYGAYGGIMAVMLITIYWLYSRNKSLEEDKEALEGEIALQKDTTLLKAQEGKADEAESNYDTVRDAYLKQSDDSSGQGKL